MTADYSTKLGQVGSLGWMELIPGVLWCYWSHLLSVWTLTEERWTWWLICARKENDNCAQEKCRERGCTGEVGSARSGAVGDHIYKKGLEIRILCWNCQGQGLNSVQKVGNCTAWKVRLVSSPDTSKMYYRLVGRGHYSDSFLHIENIQICFSKVWHSKKTSSQEHIYCFWNLKCMSLTNKWWHREKAGKEQNNENNYSCFWVLI